MTTVDEFTVTFVGSKMIKTDLLSDLLFKGVGEGGVVARGGGGKSGFVPPPPILGIANVQISLFPQYPILRFYTFVFLLFTFLEKVSVPTPPTFQCRATLKNYFKKSQETTGTLHGNFLQRRAQTTDHWN